jgi:hypothetical protein
LPALVLRKLQTYPAYADLARDFVPVQIRITFANGTRLEARELSAAGDSGGGLLVAARALYSLVHNDGERKFKDFLDRCLKGLPQLELSDVIAAVAAKCYEQPTTRHRPIFVSIVIDEAHELVPERPLMRDYSK